MLPIPGLKMRRRDLPITDAPVPLEWKLIRAFRLLLEGLGLDADSPHLKDTPERAARAWFYELCRGLTAAPPKITTFPSATHEMIVLEHIPVRSLCAHHLLPFFGEAAIGYVPGKGEILGLSKLSRIVDHWARRPQVQEVLTMQIADDLVKRIGGRKGGVGVIIRAQHLCMAMRGVTHDGKMTTSAMRGIFLKNPAVRDEFLRLVVR